MKKYDRSLLMMIKKICISHTHLIPIHMTVANHVQNGFQFQTAAAVSLIVDNLYNFKSIKNEGNNDIDLKLTSGKMIYAQAKSSFDEQSRNAKKVFKEGINSLIINYKKSNPRQCKFIYITNIKNMLGPDTCTSDFPNGQTRSYINFESSNVAIIKKMVEIPNEFSKNFGIQYLKYQGDNGEQEMDIIYKLREELSSNKDLSNLSAHKVYDKWKRHLDFNAADKNTNRELSREDMVWFMMLYLIDNIPEDICSENDEEFGEVHDRYIDYIESLTDRFEIVSEIIGDYDTENSINEITPHDFASKHCDQYIKHVENIDCDNSTKILITRILVENIIKRNTTIIKIKSAMNI